MLLRVDHIDELAHDELEGQVDDAEDVELLEAGGLSPRLLQLC